MSRNQSPIKPVTIIIIIACLGIIISLVRNAIGLYQSRSRLETAKQKVAALEQQKNTMTQAVKDQTDPAALDREIRNKLNLAKPGDTIVIIEATNAGKPNPTPILPQATPRAPIEQWWWVFTHPE
jgi:cell division protein FtsB